MNSYNHWHNFYMNAVNFSDMTFPGVSSAAAAKWKNIVKSHLSELSHSSCADDLYRKLEELCIPGIGNATIVKTVNWFLFHYDEIDKEANCSCLFLASGKKALWELDCKDIKYNSLQRIPEFKGRNLMEIVYLCRQKGFLNSLLSHSKMSKK